MEWLNHSSPFLPLQGLCQFVGSRGWFDPSSLTESSAICRGSFTTPLLNYCDPHPMLLPDSRTYISPKFSLYPAGQLKMFDASHCSYEFPVSQQVSKYPELLTSCIKIPSISNPMQYFPQTHGAPMTWILITIPVLLSLTFLGPCIPCFHCWETGLPWEPRWLSFEYLFLILRLRNTYSLLCTLRQVYLQVIYNLPLVNCLFLLLPLSSAKAETRFYLYNLYDLDFPWQWFFCLVALLSTYIAIWPYTC